MVDGLRRAASSWEVWKIALVASTMSGPMLTLGALWGTPYLETAFNLERPEAAFYTSLTLFGWAIGAPLAGWVSDKLQRRKILINFSCAMTTTALGILVFVPASSLVLTTAALIAIGFFGGTMAISFALVREQHSPEISGSAIGIVNGMTVASGALLQPLVGLVLDALNSDLVGSNATDYVASDYQWGFILIFLTALTGFIGSLFLSEKRHSPQ